VRRRTERLARRLGLDNNPLRRRTDRIQACLGAGLLVAFLVGAPFLAIAAARWAGHVGTAEQRAQRAWHEVSAILLRAAPTPVVFASGLQGGAWVPARWTAPDGRARTGEIEVSTGLAAGTKVPIWVTTEGSPTGPPLTPRAVTARAVMAAFLAPVLLATALACLAGIGRWVLDRRRLAGWDSAWASVGPHWTRRFWSRG
jgi:hypothetical protein